MYVVVNRETNKAVKKGFLTRQAANGKRDHLGEDTHAVKLEADHKGG
jgi:hypothetical protein